jgi:hypothetical protein
MWYRIWLSTAKKSDEEIYMKKTKTGLIFKSFTMCLVLILSVIFVGAVGALAEETHEEYLDGKLTFRTGTIDENNPPPWDENKEKIKADDMGDYIAIRFSKDAWFFILYGNEDNTNGILMATFQLRYLGGASVESESGENIVEKIGIPVVSVYGQKLITMIEFQDVGYTPVNMFFEEDEDETVGAHNNLWDFKRKSDRIDNLDDSFIYTEPIIKALDLNTSWTISDIKKEEIGESNKMEIDFALPATDLEYGDDKGKIWDPEYVNDETEATEVEKVEFTFHIEAKVKNNQKINDIPWYKVTVKADGDEVSVIDSESDGTRDFEGYAVNADFKFDHYLEGWDFKDPTVDSKVMLETFSIFGTFIPDIVNEWFDKQFVTNIDDALGVAEYSYDNAGTIVDEVISDQGELPNTAQLVQKEHITFRDNWRKVGDMSWISKVDVDNVEKNMYYQIHAGQNISGRGENDDGYGHALIILGGYIYPQGDVIFHDPTFTAVALAIPGLSEIAFNLLSGGGICLQLVIALIAIVVSMVVLVKRKGREKTLKERYNSMDNVDLNKEEKK